MILNDKRWQVVVPLTQKAASYFGINTRWCTTSENGGMFERYSHKGPLCIILDKPNNKRWQFHFEAGQFMDERDKPVNWGEFDPAILSMYDWPDQKLPDQAKHVAYHFMHNKAEK